MQNEVEEGIVVAAIRDSRAFWPQFGVNVAGGFVSALLFAALLAVVAFLVISDISPGEIGSELRNQVEESNDG